VGKNSLKEQKIPIIVLILKMLGLFEKQLSWKLQISVIFYTISHNSKLNYTKKRFIQRYQRVQVN
jgi:hypothetical protein